MILLISQMVGFSALDSGCVCTSLGAIRPPQPKSKTLPFRKFELKRLSVNREELVLFSSVSSSTESMVARSIVIPPRVPQPALQGRSFARALGSSEDRRNLDQLATFTVTLLKNVEGGRQHSGHVLACHLDIVAQKRDEGVPVEAADNRRRVFE